MNLFVLRPTVRQLLHAKGSDHSNCSRLEFGSTIMNGNVRRNSHLRDEVQVLLVTAIQLVKCPGRREDNCSNVPFIVGRNLHQEELLLIPESLAEGLRS